MNRKQKRNYRHQIEKQLIPRLGILGGILIFFGICSLIYGFFVHPIDVVDDMPRTEIQTEGLDLDFITVETNPVTLMPEDIFNFYLIALLFASLGLFCLFTSWKKRRIFQRIE